jgi:hypothetical protein
MIHLCLIFIFINYILKANKIQLNAFSGSLTQNKRGALVHVQPESFVVFLIQGQLLNLNIKYIISTKQLSFPYFFFFNNLIAKETTSTTKI